MRKEKRMRLQGKCADCPYAAGLIKCIVSPCSIIKITQYYLKKAHQVHCQSMHRMQAQ